jgi:hypothetical protein
MIAFLIMSDPTKFPVAGGAGFADAGICTVTCVEPPAGTDPVGGVTIDPSVDEFT